MELVDRLSLDTGQLRTASDELHFHLDLQLLHSVDGLLESFSGEDSKVALSSAHDSILSDGLPLSEDLLSEAFASVYLADFDVPLAEDIHLLQDIADDIGVWFLPTERDDFLDDLPPHFDLLLLTQSLRLVFLDFFNHAFNHFHYLGVHLLEPVFLHYLNPAQDLRVHILRGNSVHGLRPFEDFQLFRVRRRIQVGVILTTVSMSRLPLLPNLERAEVASSPICLSHVALTLKQGITGLCGFLAILEAVLWNLDLSVSMEQYIHVISSFSVVINVLSALHADHFDGLADHSEHVLLRGFVLWLHL